MRTRPASRLGRHGTWAVPLVLLLASLLGAYLGLRPDSPTSSPAPTTATRASRPTPTREVSSARALAGADIAPRPSQGPPQDAGIASGSAAAPPSARWRRLFARLEVEVGGDSLQSHLHLVRERLRERYAADAAERLAGAYAQYARYELALEGEPQLAPDDSAHEGLERLARQRELADSLMDDETAQALVHPVLDRREYLLRREIIYDDASLSVEQKRAALAELGPPSPRAAPIHASPMDDYRQALQLHAPALRKASPQQRAQLLERLRRENLPPRAVH